jgi:GNAT superfamily N-acetyltransferase
MGVMRTLDPAQLRASRSELVDLLSDAVADGASMGFMLPLDQQGMTRYWSEVAEDVESGARVCIVAARDGRIVGSVQLALCAKPNQPHRADVQKLLVHRSVRRQGIGGALVQAVEDLARERGRVLLLLDTRSGSAADRLYRRRGWQAFGIVPGFAYDPDGTLAGCTFYYKQLAPSLPYGQRAPGNS